jgi:hypothetical protein
LEGAEVTSELAAKARALSPDARRVLVVLSHGGDWRSLANIARVARMGEGRARRALLELGPLVASYSPHTVVENGYLVHAKVTAMLAEAVREVPEAGHLLSGEETA